MNSTHLFPEERRFVSVLFADIVGFTSLADNMDVELVGDLLESIWQVLDTVIENHSGRIDKHIGDGVMAIWGAPLAKDDDAELAIKSGLEMQKAFNELIAKSAWEEAKSLELRVGINSGLVLAMHVGIHNEYTVIGDTVNVASRIEQQTVPGTVYISESSARLVKDAFEVVNLPPLRLKGKAEEVNVFQVIKRSDHNKRERFRSYGGLKTNFVGRNKELAQLEKAYAQVLEDKSPHFVLVVGETGIGKSRLMMEFVSSSIFDLEEIFVLSGRALAQADKIPFYLWKSLCYNLFEIKEDDPPEIARLKLIDGMKNLLGDQVNLSDLNKFAHAFSDLIGISIKPTEQQNDVAQIDESKLKGIFKNAVALLTKISIRSVVILIIDDIQWADDGSLKLISEILKNSPSPSKILIIGASRPEVIRRHPELKNLATLISLKPLNVNSAMLKEAYPDLEDYPSRIINMISKQSGGNPYFMEELTKNLISADFSIESLMESKDNSDQLVPFPESLQISLQARIDSLSPEARGVLLLASVIGRVFWKGALIASIKTPLGITQSLNISSVSIENKIDGALRELAWSEIAFPKTGSDFSNEEQYIIKHSLLHEVAYELLPLKTRRKSHLVIAKWLIERAGSDYFHTIAEHFEKGLNYKKARHYYGLAIINAQSRGANDLMEVLLEKMKDIERA